MVSSSARAMRCCAPETTLRHAKQWAATAGISEVTEITDRDVLGVPVYVSVRPQALEAGLHDASDAGRIVAIALVDLHLEHCLSMARIDADHRQAKSVELGP